MRFSDEAGRELAEFIEWLEEETGRLWLPEEVLRRVVSLGLKYIDELAEDVRADADLQAGRDD